MAVSTWLRPANIRTNAAEEITNALMSANMNVRDSGYKHSAVAFAMIHSFKNRGDDALRYVAASTFPSVAFI